MMLEFWQKDFSTRKADLTKMAAEYSIIHVEPLGYNESKTWHLLLVTQNSFRIFLHFEELEVSPV
jgi:hypothetical protein